MRLLAPFALVTYGIAFAAASLGRSLLVYDDHPGQLYRLWHVVTHGPAPWAWNPGWWAGYPEQQFYPPGAAYLGALLYALLPGSAALASAYQLLLWITYLAPGLTAFLLLARALGDGWLALPGAFVALTLSAGVASGVEGGVHTGMIAARLGWALLPALPLALGRFVDLDDDVPMAGVVVVAAIALLHPAHLPSAVTLVFLVALQGVPARGLRLRHTVAALALAAGCTAFWTVPLLARLASTRALAWGTLSLPALPLTIALVLAAVAALITARTPLERALARWPWLVLTVVMVDRFALEPLGLRWLPADRVIDGAWLALVLAAGLAVGRLLQRIPERRGARAAGAVGAIAVAVALSIPGGALSLWPEGTAWPTYEATTRGLRMVALWDRLAAAPPGRILFVRSGVPLVHGTAWYRAHTHITSLTPMATGRPIVHGTFTHPSVVAAYVYRGPSDGGAITELAEQLDGRVLLGRPLHELAQALDDGAADRLGISAVVGLEDDVPALQGLVDGGKFSATAVPPFIVYTRKQRVTVPAALEGGRWQFQAEGDAGTWVTARVAYYPLWRADANGEARSVRPGVVGDLEVRLGRRDETVTLVYAAGIPERVGVGLSIASGLLLVTTAVRRRLLSGSGRPSSSDRGSPPRTDRSTA